MAIELALGGCRADFKLARAGTVPALYDFDVFGWLHASHPRLILVEFSVFPPFPTPYEREPLLYSARREVAIVTRKAVGYRVRTRCSLAASPGA